jgi:hypothetical protein
MSSRPAPTRGLTRRETPSSEAANAAVVTPLTSGAIRATMERPTGSSAPVYARPNLGRGIRNITYTQVEWNIEGEPERLEYDETPLGWVYFILDPNAAQIKIGYTAGRTIGRRLAQHRLRRKDLTVLGTLRGGRSLERALHSRFAEHRREGREWFSSEIAADVLWLIDGEKACDVAA